MPALPADERSTVPAAPLRAMALIAVLAAALALAPARDEVANQIKAREPEDRVVAVDKIRRDGHKEAEKLLLDALDDRDWEVMERAALALAERGSAAGSGPALSKLVLEGPIRRVRLAAALALAKLAPETAGELLTKAAKGPALLRACEGLAAIAATVGEGARAGLETGLLSKDSATRATAAAGLHAFPAAERATHLVTCLKDDDLTIGAAALDSATRHPDAALLPTLLDAFVGKELPEVFERRLVNAVEALLRATPATERGKLESALFDAAQKINSDPPLARFARMVGRLAAAPPAGSPADTAPLLPVDTATNWLAPIGKRGSAPAAAAAAKALSLIATARAQEALVPLAEHASPRARAIALRGLAETAGSDVSRLRPVALKLLADPDADVREDAAVALGRPGMSDTVAALLPLLKDGDWPVAVAAAVSIGKTQEPEALAPLLELAKAKEWKLAGAALVGLGHLKRKEAVPALIAALGEKAPTLKLTAFEILRRLTRDKLPAKESNWKSWWAKQEAKFAFPDPAENAKQQQKYGYAPSDYGVYEDLDLLVFQSRGDHIEKLLEKLKITHRTTHGGGVPDSGVSPLGIYVANCTGECGPDDLEQVQWAVHAGGYLFSSCWALTHHSSLVRPGYARQLPTPKGEVLDLVTAEPCRESPYLAGVFEGATRPKYVLEGAHLIDVLDHDRVEVLIDSPECATNWGGGNLAAWWSVGHGLILDSVNHFDLQGFERAPQMKEPAERMAYAVDVLGLSYADLRDVPKGAWQSQQKASEEVRDLSAFRFITNFVRQMRKRSS